MTPVRFDPETATLRLDRESFATLVAHATQPTGDAAHLIELREAGALRDGQYHPALEAGLDAVLNPVCRLEVRVADANGREDHGDGWVAGHAAGFLLPGQEGGCDFVVDHPGFVPERVARIVRLGPRPRAFPAGQLELGTELLDELTAADPGRRAAGLQRVQDTSPGGARVIAGAIATGFRARWEVEMRWLPAPRSTGQRTLHVVDTETALWAVEPAGTGLAVGPTTPTTVWRRRPGVVQPFGRLGLGGAGHDRYPGRAGRGGDGRGRSQGGGGAVPGRRGHLTGGLGRHRHRDQPSHQPGRRRSRRGADRGVQRRTPL